MTYKQCTCPGETRRDFTAITNMTARQMENALICSYSEGHERQNKEAIISN